MRKLPIYNQNTALAHATILTQINIGRQV